MKKLFAAFAVLLVTSLVGAHSVHGSELPAEKAKPGTFNYGVMKAQESISLALTFNKKEKAKKHLKFAERRLVEAENAADEGEKEKAGELVKNYQKQLGKAQEIKSQLSESEREEVQEEINQSSKASIEVLEDLSDRVPEQAKAGIQQALDNVRKQGKPEDTGKRDGTGNRDNNTGRTDNAGKKNTDQEASQGYVATGKVVTAGE